MRTLDPLGADLPSLLLRDIPPPLYDRLRERASLHRRSVHSELLIILEGVLGPRRISSAEILAALDHLSPSARPSPAALEAP